MEEGLRKSSRRIKVRKEPGFVYDDESVGFLVSTSQDRSETWQHRIVPHSEGQDLSADSSATEQCSVRPKLSNSASWSDIYSLPLYYKDNSKSSVKYGSDSVLDRTPGSIPLGEIPISVNGATDVNKQGRENIRRHI